MILENKIGSRLDLLREQLAALLQQGKNVEAAEVAAQIAAIESGIRTTDLPASK